MSPTPLTPATAENTDFEAIQVGEDYRELRRTHRSFVLPMTLAFLAWYWLYVILAVYAPDLMAIRLVGNINLGLVLGLLQFVTTFGITGWYVAFANKKLDPRAKALRAQIEAGHFATGKTR